MKCKSCQGEVSPKFAHAIAINMCPLCGEAIMEPELQNALKNLKTAMEISALYPDEVFDWLKSNYNLIKQSVMDDAMRALEATVESKVATQVETIKATYYKPTPKSGKGSTTTDSNEVAVDKDGNQLEGETIQSQEMTNKFMKNAGVNKMVERNEHYKKIVNEIKKNGAPALIDENGGSGVVTPDMLKALDADETEELQAYFGSEPGVSSSLDGDYDDDDDIPSVVLGMANQAKRAQGGNYNPKDIAALQEIHGKAKKASRALSSGGSVGLIKR